MGALWKWPLALLPPRGLVPAAEGGLPSGSFCPFSTALCVKGKGINVTGKVVFPEWLLFFQMWECPGNGGRTLQPKLGTWGKGRVFFPTLCEAAWNGMCGNRKTWNSLPQGLSFRACSEVSCFERWPAQDPSSFEWWGVHQPYIQAVKSWVNICTEEVAPVHFINVWL